MRRMTRISAVGGADSLRRQLEQILALTGADELIATAHIYDAQARLRSFKNAVHEDECAGEIRFYGQERCFL